MARAKSIEQIQSLLRDWKRYRLGVFVAFAVFVPVVLFKTNIQYLKFLENLDNQILDIRFQWRGVEKANEHIAIVAVGDSSMSPDTFTPEDLKGDSILRYMQPYWPWDRRVFARVLERLIDDGGARLVVFDMVFLTARGEGDFDFADAIAKYQDKTILGYRYVLKHETDSGQSKLKKKGQAMAIQYPFDDLLPLDDTDLLGLVNSWQDSDNVIRRSKLSTSIIEEKENRHDKEDDLFVLAYVAAKKSGLEHAELREGKHLINFAGRGFLFPYYRIEALFQKDKWNNDTMQQGKVFQDKIVFVGPLAETFKDSFATPFGTMPGVEIHANVLSTLLNKNGIEEISRAQAFWVTLIITSLVFIICVTIKKPLLKVISVVALIAVYAVLTQMLFAHQHLLFDFVEPALAVFICGSLFITFDFAIEQYERHRVRSTLDRYVTRNIADVVLQSRGSFEELLKGKRGNVTVFFSDIRGFTSLSEAMDAEVLVTQLNEYFLAMVDIVLEEGGTLQKFIGDAIMAVWGDTYALEEREGVRRAVSTALQMRDKLETLNAGWEAEGRLALGIGMGINFGEAIVGNIGHPQRMEFTVLGDAVNLASRLEGATKQYKQQILVGEAAYQLSQEDFYYRFADRIQVKGKKEPVSVYVPLLEKKDDHTAPEGLEAYENGIELYLNREFEAALVKLREARLALGNEDYLCQEYIERCQNFIKNRPGGDWDGTVTLTSK